MNIFERQVGGRRYRIASQSLWDPARQRPFARQAVLGPADAPPMARAVVRRFEVSTDVLAFDTTNFDTHIATTTPGELARRGKAKSKWSDLRVVGLATLVSETGHVPLLHRTYPGNG